MDEIDQSNPQYQALRRMIEQTDASVFLTGRAGTGKSTFLRHIIAGTSKECVVLAPTGVAAVNVGGQTLHSFFHLPLQPFVPDDTSFAPSRLRERLNLNGRNIKVFRKVELVVIDEISMVRADVLDLVDRILRTFGGDRRKPFGGKQLLLVGDVYQLEPVVTQEDKAILQRHYSNFFFFGADVFRDIAPVCIELQKVYRQTESRFVALLDKFRGGQPSQADIDAVNKRVCPCEEDDNASGPVPAITLAARRDAADRVNTMRLARLESEPVVGQGEVTGEFPQSSYPTSLSLTLKKGAQVMFLRNDPERRWVNGTIGTVEEADSHGVEVRLPDGNIHPVEPQTWENVCYEFDNSTNHVSVRVKGTFTQLPLRTAWAITIHKSQGLTFDRVRLDIGAGGAFAGGQTYVALSRCKTLGGISLERPLDLKDVYINPQIVAFSRTFNDEIAQRQALETAATERLLQLAASGFAAGRIAAAADALGEALERNPGLNTPALRRLIGRKLAKAMAASQEPTRKRGARSRKA